MKRNGDFRRGAAVLLLLLLTVGLLLACEPSERHAERFVSRYGTLLAERIGTDGAIPANIGIRMWNVWSGEHEMWEFILRTRGGRYGGCYYSPDDVPCAFQNADVPLVLQKDGLWTWQGEGDNRGSTWWIKPHWYGFEASF